MQAEGLYRPTVVSLIYRQQLRNSQTLDYLAVHKPNWGSEEWGLVQGEQETHLDASDSDTVLRESREELGTTLFLGTIDTGIKTQRLFSPASIRRYSLRQYVGKESKYFGLEYMGRDEDIHLGQELDAFQFLGRERLLRTVKYAHELPPVLDIIERTIREQGLMRSSVLHDVVMPAAFESFELRR